MKKGRRDFLKTSVATGLLGLTDVSAKANAKRTAHKARQSRHTHRLSLPNRIVVISSIGYTGTTLQTSFESAATAASPGLTFATPLDAKGYHPRVLYDHITTKGNNDSSVGLIAAVGGFVTWDAALFAATKPFISIIGGQFPLLPSPATPANATTSQFWGAIDLQSFSANASRIAYLGSGGGAGQNFIPSDITLLFNPNSRMASLETAAWTGATPIPCGSNSTTEENDQSTFQSAFANVTTKAVIISADPFFNHYRHELILAANGFLQNSSNYVCYPTFAYKDDPGAVAPTAGQSLFYGPHLDNAYKLLGTMAGTILSTGMPASIIPAPIKHFP